MGPRRRHWQIPLILGAVVLSIIFLAALTPNLAGTVAAQSTCPQYNNCATSNNTGVPTWEWALIAALVIAALIAIVLLAMRRRRPPAPVSWQGPEGPAGGQGGSSTEFQDHTLGANTDGLIASGSGLGAATAGAAVGSAAALSSVPSGATGGGVESAAPHVESGENIDSLMDELDKLSQQILTKSGKPPTPPPPTG